MFPEEKAIAIKTFPREKFVLFIAIYPMDDGIIGRTTGRTNSFSPMRQRDLRIRL